MARTEMIELAFAALEISRHTALLAEGVERAETAGDQFVRVGLVTHIPHHAILVQIKGLIEGQGEFHHTKPRSEMATAGGHHLKMTLPDLTGDVFQIRDAETMQLIRMGQISEMHAPPAPIHAIYEVRPAARWPRAVKRMEG